MATFLPPIENEGPAGGGPLFSRYKLWRGVSVVLENGHYTNHRWPTVDDLAGLTEGTDYFIGGHTYTVSAAVAAALTADGYGAYLT
jgi:hypothetical protein